MKNKPVLKTLSFMLSLVMLLALVPGIGIATLAADSYQLWVGGEEVMSDKLSGEGWNYNADNHTLTLTDYGNNNAYYTEPEAGVYDPDYGYRIAAGIYYAGKEKLTVALVGANTLTMPAFSINKLDNAAIFSKGDIAFTGAGSLNATGGAASDSSDKSNAVSYGLFAGGKAVTVECSGGVNLTGNNGEYSYGAYTAKSVINVTGTGKITFTGGAAIKESCGYYAEWGGINVTDGGQFTAVGGTVTGAAGKSYGICNGVSNITVKKGTLYAYAGNVEGAGGKSIGLYSIIGPCYFDEGAKVDCQSRNISGDGGESFGIRCAGLNVNGGNVTAAGAAADDSCGVYNDISMRIESGTLTAGGGSALRSYGMYSKGQIEVSGGKVTATGYNATENSSGIFLAARTFSNGTVEGGTLTVSGGEVAATGEMYGVFSDPAFEGKAVVITDGTVTAKGKTVSLNKVPIFGASVTASGSAAFDGGTPSEYAENANGTYKWLKTAGDPNPKTIITKLLFTVEEPAAGAVPAKKVQIASVPENALTVTEYDAVWLESDDSVEYEDMTSATFEAGKYYTLKLPDENNAGGPLIALAASGYALSEDPVYTVNGEDAFVLAPYLIFFGPLEAGSAPANGYAITSVTGLSGTNNKQWTKGTGEGVVITVKASGEDDSFDRFTGVKLDGRNLVKDADYTVKKGSTVVTLKPSTLEKLSVGEHTVTVLFNNGEVNTTLTVAAPASANGTSPKTGGNSNFELWIMLMSLSLCGIAVTALIGKKKKFFNR